MPEQKILALGIPSNDMLHADFAMSLIFVAAKAGCPFVLVNSKSSNVARQRNIIVEEAKANKATHLLFLDSDMTFPPDTAAKLFAHDKDIVGATYPKRVPPHNILGCTLGPARDVTEGLHRMTQMPTGCLMIKMSVFEKLAKPYFAFGIRDGEVTGEDVNFCAAAIDAGFEIWCDVGLTKELGHIGQMVYKAT